MSRAARAGIDGQGSRGGLMVMAATMDRHNHGRSRRDAGGGHHAEKIVRCAWTERIALEPSPTAAATPVIGPWRAAPAGQRAGGVVSEGSRHPAAAVHTAPPWR